jgi:hypothetical protein
MGVFLHVRIAAIISNISPADLKRRPSRRSTTPHPVVDRMEGRDLLHEATAPVLQAETGGIRNTRQERQTLEQTLP